jgi:hypothetical protein
MRAAIPESESEAARGGRLDGKVLLLEIIEQGDWHIFLWYGGGDAYKFLGRRDRGDAAASITLRTRCGGADFLQCLLDSRFAAVRLLHASSADVQDGFGVLSAAASSCESDELVSYQASAWSRERGLDLLRILRDCNSCD